MIDRGLWSAHVMDEDRGFGWDQRVAYACHCGAQFSVCRRWWIDGEASPLEVDRVRERGPLRGRCGVCAREAEIFCRWLEILPRQKQAILHLEEAARVDLGGALKLHLEQANRRNLESHGELPPWMWQPRWNFDVATASARNMGSKATAIPSIVPVGGDLNSPSTVDEGDKTGRVASAVPQAVGQVIFPQLASRTHAMSGGREESFRGESRGNHVTSLDVVGGLVTIDHHLDEDGRIFWGAAVLHAQPVHLREHGYPLVGVRMVASYLGELSILDAVVDVAEETVNHAFSLLSREFRIGLVLDCGPNNTPVRRSVECRGLERNAALCLESARAALGAGKFSNNAFADAKEHLRRCESGERLAEAEIGISPGDFRHLISAAETEDALKHLDAASQKTNLALLLEVEGLAIHEYEAIRSRVLRASLEFGLVAPRRFWRRIVGSGLVSNLTEYVEMLVAGRLKAQKENSDLPPEIARARWSGILDLCEQKNLPRPPDLTLALGLDMDRRRGEYSDGNRSRSASGEIHRRSTRPRVSVATLAHASASPRNIERLRGELADPGTRLGAATSALASRNDVEALEQVVAVLEGFSREELLALLPSLAEMGTLTTAPLVGKLASKDIKVRQSAAILLELAGDPVCLRPLVAALGRDESKAWVDLARALGSFGSRALGPLCALLRQMDGPVPAAKLRTRVAWAMSEICLSDGVDGSGSAADAVEALASAPETEVALAAQRALATLHEVAAASAQVRGRLLDVENTAVRGFAHAAYETISAPEFDVVDKIED